MKRLFLVLAAACALPAALMAQELSAALNTGLKASNTDVSDFTVYEEVAPNFTLPIGASAEFAGSGFIKGAYSSAYAANSASLDGTAPFTYGLDELRLEAIAKAPQAGIDSLVFDVGRFQFDDPSGDILYSPADGLGFSFRYPNLELNFRSAYTGLLFEDDSPISMSLADKANNGVFGSPRFLFETDLDVPNLFGQSFAFSVLGQNDLTPSSSILAEGSTTRDPSMGGRLSTQYFELEASGAISTVGYQAFVAYGTGTTLSWIASSPIAGSYEYKPISSFLGGFNASLPLALPIDGSTLACQFLFASGDTNASQPLEGNTQPVYGAFTPISSTSLGLVFSPSLSNIVLGELSFGAKPKIGTLSLDGLFKLMAFFRPTLGPIYVTSVNIAPSSSYLGSEADLSLSCGIRSDVEVSCSLGLFVPQSASNVQYSGSVVASIKI